MSWVSSVSAEQASPEVRNVYNFLQENWGFVPNYFQALGGHPQLLQDQVNMFTHLMFEERALPRAIKEQIALVVSGINLSNYCLAAHLEILGRLGFEKSFARKLALNFECASRAENNDTLPIPCEGFSPTSGHRTAGFRPRARSWMERY